MYLLALEMDMNYLNISQRQSEMTIGDITLRGQLVLNESKSDIPRYTVKILSKNRQE